MKKTIACLFILLCLSAILAGCGTGGDEQDLGFYTTDEECFQVETRYGMLEYPEKWKEIAEIEIVDEYPYTVRFAYVTSEASVPLFNLYFNGGTGFLLGAVNVDGVNIPIYLDSMIFDRDTMSEEDYNKCCAMQEDVNVIISHLIEKNGLVLPDTSKIIEDDGNVYAIETKYGNLFYPEKWAKIAKTEIVDEPVYTVKFSCKTSAGDIPLYDLTFNGEEGNYVGQMNVGNQSVVINIIEYDFDKEIMSEEEYLNCCAMYNDINVIIEHLTEDYGFAF